MKSSASSRLRIRGGDNFNASSEPEARVLVRCFARQNVQLNVVGLGILADYHAGVDTFTRSDKERTALLGIEQTVSQ